MNLERAKELFNEIADICYQTENTRLIEAIEPLYRDVEYASDVEQIMSINFKNMKSVPQYLPVSFTDID